MLNFIVRRLMAAMVALFLLSIATFTLLRVMPGDEVLCPSFCSREQHQAPREEYGFNKPLFPISFTGDAIWLLVLPVAAASGYAVWRGARRIRGSAFAGYVVPRLAWNLALGALLAVLLSMSPGFWPEPIQLHAPSVANQGISLAPTVVLLLAGLLAGAMMVVAPRPRVMNIPRAN